MTNVVISSSIVIILFLIGFFLQETSNRAIFFGVRIPIGYEKNEKLINLKKEYRKHYTVSSLIFFAVYFLLLSSLAEYFALIMVVGAFSFIIVINVNYYLIHIKVKELKKAEKWSSYTDKIVVVDMKYRVKDKGNKAVVISSWWFLIPVSIIAVNIVLVFAAYNGFVAKLPFLGLLGEPGLPMGRNYKSFVAMITIQAAVTILLFVVCKAFERAKQLLNVGEIKEVREQSRYFRYILSALMLFIAIILNISYFISSLTMLGWLEPGEKTTMILLLGLLFLPLVAAIVIFAIVGQSGRKLKVEDEIQGDKLIINRDDDDHYIMGTMYYNKQDPALMVEKRVGIGMDFNYARPAAKVILGGIGVLVLFVIILLTQLPNATKEGAVKITSDTVTISGMWGVTLKTEEVTDVSIEQELPQVIIKTNGAGLGNKMRGHFNLKEYGSSTLFIMDKTKPFVRITTKDKEPVLINYEDDTKTQELFKELAAIK